MIYITKTTPRTNITVELCGYAIQIVVSKLPEDITADDVIKVIGNNIADITRMNIGSSKVIFYYKHTGKQPRETWFTIKDYHLPEDLFNSIWDNKSIGQSSLKSCLKHILKNSLINNVIK